MTTVCDVCLGECPNGGVLACGHLLCRTCGMTQGKCLVCAEVGDKARRRRNLNFIRLGKDLPTALPTKEGTPPPQFKPKRAAAVAAASAAAAAAAALPKAAAAVAAAARPALHPASMRPAAHSMQHGMPHAARNPTEFAGRSPRSPPVKIPRTPDAQANTSGMPAVAASASPPAPRAPASASRKRSASPGEEDAGQEPPLKAQRREGAKEENVEVKVVHAPTVHDEVRMELSPLNGAPKLTRPALRTSTRLTVKLLRDFLHQTFHLSPSQQVVLTCAGEELTDAMTVGNLRNTVWPRDGHMLLDYGVKQKLARVYGYKG